jgi:Bacterial Ig-like domain/HYR domain
MVSSICTTKLGVAALALFTGVALCLLALAFDAPPADAATATVPCSADGLIGAIEVANANGPGPDTIELAPDCTYALSSPYVSLGLAGKNYVSWYGPSGLPAIASDITVEGNGATIERVAAAGTPFRLLFVGADPTDPDTFNYATPGAGDLTLRDLTLRGGLAQGGDAIVGGGGGAGMGGAIFNQGEVTLERVTITNSVARGGNGGSASGVGPGGGIGSNAGSTANSSGGGFGVGFVALGGGSGGFTSGGGGGFRAFEDGYAGVAPLTGGDGGGPATGLGGLGGAATGNPGRGGNGAGGGTPTSAIGGAGGDFGRGGVEGGGGGVGGGGATLGDGSGGGFGGGGGGANGEGGYGGFGGGGGNGSSIGFGGFGGGNGALVSSSGGGGGGAGMGGAIFNHQGELTLLNSTLSGNTAVGGLAGPAANAGRGLGGAIFNLNGAVRIDYSTIAYNRAISYNTADDGGALYNLGYLAEDTGDPDVHTYSAHVGAAGSIITPAVVSAAPAMVSGGLQNTVDDPGDTTIDLTASNLIGAATEIGDGAVLRGPNTLEGDPVLGLLAENGGLTPTHALSPASPAIDTAQGTCPSTDQRGAARPSGFACDIGAFELNYFTPPKDVTSPVLSLPEDITQEATSSDGATVNWSATATDNVDASVTVNCDKASGDTFPFGTTTITCSATDAAGNKAEGSFNVTVVAARDTTAPTVFSTTPGNNGTMTNKASNVMATFSEDVKNVDATTFKLEQVKVSRKGVETTSPVAATVTPASGTVAQGASATLNPKKDLQKASTYRATLTSGVTDTAGNALSATYTWTFQVSR